jgi:hypothetical protein
MIELGWLEIDDRIFFFIGQHSIINLAHVDDVVFNWVSFARAGLQLLEANQSGPVQPGIDSMVQLRQLLFFNVALVAEQSILKCHPLVIIQLPYKHCYSII